jgi:hypothetical protein
MEELPLPVIDSSNQVPTFLVAILVVLGAATLASAVLFVLLALPAG